MRKIRMLTALVLALATSALAAGVATTQAAAKPAAKPKAGLSAPITAADSGGVLDGVFTVTSFTQNDAGDIVANGTFVGTAVINGVTTPVSTTATSVVTPSGSCTILDLTLGPLHLDLLGLVVDLNQVHLVITAEQGSGNLLGNLLCAVANLLNPNPSPTALDQIVNLLNQILARL